MISVIIITVLLVIISVSISTTSFFSRFNVADAEYKKRSSDLAEACVDAELLKLAEGSTYLDGQSVPVGGDSCTMVRMQTDIPIVGQTTIQAKAKFPSAVFYQAVTNIQITVDSGSFSLISWQELPTL